MSFEYQVRQYHVADRVAKKDVLRKVQQRLRKREQENYRLIVSGIKKSVDESLENPRCYPEQDVPSDTLPAIVRENKPCEKVIHLLRDTGLGRQSFYLTVFVDKSGGLEDERVFRLRV